MSKKTLALLGAGHWGKNLARNFYELGTLHTICDPRQQILDEFQEKYPDITTATDVNEVVTHEAINRVAIAAPAEQHYPQAKQVLEAGKDVYVEKPLCLDVTEADDLIALAEKHQRILMVGHLLQYHPCVEKLKELVGKGELGQLQYITSNRLNLGKIRTEENALWSFAPHDLSVILSLTGDRLPTDVHCTGGSYLTGGVADTTLTAMAFPTGVRSHVYVSWLNPFKEQKLTVVGSHAMVVFDDTQPWEQKLAFYEKPVVWQSGTTPTPNKVAPDYIPPPEEEPLQKECQHFLTACDERSRPKTDGAEGRRVLRLLRAAQQSLDRNGTSVNPEELLAEDSPDFFAHDSAVVADTAQIGKGTKIWHFSHVMKNAELGEKCILGQNVHVAPEVKIGNCVKIQNNVSVYTGVELEDYVFLAPACVFTNVTNPRAEINRHSLYEKTLVRRGATVGANATVLCGVTIGRYAFIAAGATVTRDVPDYALIMGTPGKRVGWMSRHGHKIDQPSANGIMTCPESGLRYKEVESGVLRCLDLDEQAELPEHLRTGNRSYSKLKGTKQ